jgi:hypothetical protein
MAFICEDRFVFDLHHAAFMATGAQPRLLPPVLVGRGCHSQVIFRRF